MNKLIQDKKTKKFHLDDNKDESYSLVEMLELFRQTNLSIFQGLTNLNERLEKLEDNKSKIIV